MADKFVLTAQLQLQAPTNVNQVLNQVRSQLSRGNTNIQANVQTTGMAQANKQMQNLSKSAQSASTSMKSANNAAGGLVKTLGAAARRFAAITVATGTFLAIARSIGEATRKAIEFETEMIKISQVTGKSLKSLQGLNREVTKIATNMGVSSQEILSASRTLLQAGFSADKVTKSLKILAQTDLAATFDSIQDTTEGAIALLRQFRNEAIRAGGDVKFLEQSLNAINAVSKNFAVESADLITVIRKTGGVFEAAGGSLNELLALFTSVRATTRESADTIAVGFRTIFTRIQRTETIEQLKELGIVLQDSTGKFVGPLEAIKRLQAGLSSLDPRDYRFAEIVEQLGGFRQIGKVIPLLKQYGTTAEALAIANAAAGENAEDAAKAQQGLGNQVTKLKEKFDALIRTFVDGKTFKSLAAGAIALAEAFIRIAESLEPLLPMLTTLLSLKLGQLALPAVGKFAMGGGPRGFNKGGLVPGQGNFDTVPAMLTPGEFVMRKSAVKNIGASNMASMNARGYAAGGKVSGTRNFYGNGPIKQDDKMLQRIRAQGQAAQTGKKAASVVADSTVATFTPRRGAGQAIGLVSAEGTDTQIKSTGSAVPFDITNEQIRKFVHQKRISAGLAEKGSPVPAMMKGQIGPGEYDVFHPNLTDIKGGIGGAIDTGVRDGLGTAMQSAIRRIESSRVLDIPPGMQTDEKMINRFTQPLRNDKQVISTMAGYMFEGVLGALSGASITGGTEFFDFPASVFGTVKPKVAKIFGSGINVGSKAELKRKKKKLYGADGIVNKVENDLLKSGYTSQSGLKLTGFNRGGGVSGSDTVPAMLTPGEFVINKKSASGIGYANLQRMNQSGGVKGYAAGGIVTPSRYNYGPVPPGQSAGASGQMTQNMMMLAMTVGMVTSSLSGLSEETQAAINTFGMTASMGLMLVNTFKEMGTSMAANIRARKASTAAENKESLANKQAVIGETEETVANKMSAASEMSKAQKARAGAMTGLGIGAQIGVIIYAAFEAGAAYFAKVAQQALERSFEAFDEAVEAMGAGDQELAGAKFTETQLEARNAIIADQKSDLASNMGIGGGIGAGIGGLIGGAIGAAFAGVGAVPGAIIGAEIFAAIGMAIGAAVSDTDSGPERKAMRALTESAFMAAGAMQQFDNEIMLIKESGVGASEAMNRLRSASSTYQNNQQKANAALKRYQTLIQNEETKGELADSETVQQWVEKEAEIREQMVSQARNYAQTERETRQALIDDLAAGGGDIGEIFNDPRIKASRDAYIKFLAQAMGGGENAIKEATKVADEIDKVKREEIEASRKAAQAAREAAAARLQEIQLIREHNSLMYGLNQMLNQLTASAQQLSATQGILNNEFKKMPTAAADALATAISDFEGTTVEEYINALDAATAEAPQRVKEAANRSGFYKKLFAAAEDKLEDLVGDAGQLEGAAGLDGSGPSSEDVQKKFRTAFADILKDLPDDIEKSVNKNLAEAAEDGIITPDEFEKILDPIKDAAERGAAAAKLYLQAQEQYLQDYLDASNALVAQIQRESEARANVIDVEERGRRRIQEATGRRPDRAARERARVNAARVRLGGQGNLVGDIAALRDSIIANRTTMNNNNESLKDNNKRVSMLGTTFKTGQRLTVEDRKKLASENVKLAQESANATAELKRLADQSERAADVMADIERERDKRQAVQDSIKEFTFATNEGRADINKSFYALSRVLQTGNLNSIPDDLRASVGGILDQFKDIQIFGGMTGSDISKQLQIQTMDQQMRLVRGRGLTDDEKKTIYEATPAEEQFIQELRAINAEEVAAANALAAAEQANTEMMTQLLTKIDGLLTALKAEFEARPMASGGMVYAAGGGSIFKPRGTDTVPAMLTPGEFVIKKSAVDKVGLGTLSAINGGGSPVYKAEGGLVGGNDAIRMTARNMGVAKIRELYGLEGAKAFKDNDVAALIEASGSDKSPFAIMKNVLDTLAKYSDMFSGMSATAIGLKPNSGDRWRQMLESSTGIMDAAWGSADVLKPYNPAFFAGISALRALNDQVLAGEDAPSVEGKFGVQATSGKLSEKQKKELRAENSRRRREESKTVAAPIFKDGMVVGTDPTRPRISVADFNKQRAKAQQMHATAVASSAAAKKREEERVKKVQAQAEHLNFSKKLYAPLEFNRTIGESLGYSDDEDRQVHEWWASSQYGATSVAPHHRSVAGDNAVFLTKAEEDIWKEGSPFTWAEHIARWRAKQTKVMGNFARLMYSSGRNLEGYSYEFAEMAHQGERHPQFIEEITEDNFGIREKGKKPKMPDRDNRATGRRAHARWMSGMKTGTERSAQAAEVQRSHAHDAVLPYVKPARFASGGMVDTVPAMLTPGEFVMNNSAVSKYGTGFMKALNQGRVQGFNKGGVVYAANGSQGGVSGGSGIDNIMGGNSDQLERIAQTFALVMKAFTSVANIFGNMSMTHQVNFGGSIKIDFPNADMISASIAQGAAAQISQMVDEKIESAIENLQNGPG